MKSETSKKVIIFFVSFVLVLASFLLFIMYFPFPRVPKEVVYDRFLYWVAGRTSLYTPYKYWWPLALAYVPAMTFGLWYALSYLWKVKLSFVTYFEDKKEALPRFTPLEVGLVSFLIIFLVVNFSYSSFYQFFYNFHHLNFITGPLNDVLNGKYLLIDTKTQYGFLNILLTSFLFKLGFYFSHANIHFISMVLGFIEYLLVYIILRILTKSIFYSILGIIFTTAIHFYGVFPILFPSELYVWPGGSVWRFFPGIPTALCLLLWLRTDSKRWFYTTQVMVIVGLLWNTESGVPLLLAYFAALLLYAFYLRASLFEKIKVILSSFVSLVGILFLCMLFYSVYTKLSIGIYPDWSQLYFYTVLFNNGFLQYPDRAPLFGFSYWPIAMYTAGIFLAMTRPFFRRGLPMKDIILLVFLSIYGYGIYRYYVGKQSPSDLAAVIIPGGIIFLYLAYHFFQMSLPYIVYIINQIITKTQVTFPEPIQTWWSKQAQHSVKTNKERMFVAGFVLVSIFFIMAGVKFTIWTVTLTATRYKELDFVMFNPNINFPPKNRIIPVENAAHPTIPLTHILDTVEKMKKYTKGEKRIAMLGYFDHILMMQSETVNMAPYNYMHATMYTKKEQDEVYQLYATKPQYMFVDKRILRNNTTDYVMYPGELGESVVVELFSDLRKHYDFVEDIGMVYVYKRI